MQEQWLSRGHLVFDKRAVDRSCAKDFEAGVTADDISAIKRCFAGSIAQLGKRAGLRQRCISTAVVYFRRFFARPGASFRDCPCDPPALAAACLFLASKVEENPASARTICDRVNQDAPGAESAAARPLFGEPYRLDEGSLVRAELVLLEGLGGRLLVQHPHSRVEGMARSLADTLPAGGPSARQLAVAGLCAANDSARTDAPLLYTPQVLAVACLLTAGALHGVDGSGWAATALGGAAGAERSALAACAALLAEGEQTRQEAQLEYRARVDAAVMESLRLVRPPPPP